MVRHLDRILDATVALDEHLGAEGRPIPAAAELVGRLVDALSAIKVDSLGAPSDGDALAGIGASRHQLDDLVDRLVRQRARALTSYHGAEPAMDTQLRAAGLLPVELGQLADALADLTVASRHFARARPSCGRPPGLPSERCPCPSQAGDA
jgi:hypothetical protein